MIGMSCNSLFAQDCGGKVTGMNITVLSSTGFRVQFFRPLWPEKDWPTKGVPEYEHNYLIKIKPSFPKPDTASWIKDMDTTTISWPVQFVANEHSTNFDYLNLCPATSYNVCIYTRCGTKLEGPLCSSGTTSKDAPCTLKADSMSSTSRAFRYVWKPDTRLESTLKIKKIVFEYREKKGDWQVMNPSCSAVGSVNVYDLKPGVAYIARVKFIYINNAESSYSDELVFRN